MTVRVQEPVSIRTRAAARDDEAAAALERARDRGLVEAAQRAVMAGHQGDQLGLARALHDLEQSLRAGVAAAAPAHAPRGSAVAMVSASRRSL